MPRRKSCNQQPQESKSSTSQMAALIEALKNLPRDSIFSDPETRKLNFFKELDRLNPPTFNGDPDPLVADNWLRVMARMFDTLGIPEDYKVGFAIYYLRMHAEVWWNSVGPYHDIALMDWENFKLLFRENYFNSGHREKLISAYHDLVQGDMTVLDYLTRFRELSLCIEGMDPAGKVMKFRMGLHPRIRSSLAVLEFDNIPEVANAAQRMEAVLTKNYDDKRDNSNKRKITKKNKSQEHRQGSQGTTAVSGSSSATSCGRYGPYTCYSCGWQGHVRKDCPMRQQNAPQPPTWNPISDTMGSSSSVGGGFSGQGYLTCPMQQTFSPPQPSGHRSVYYHQYHFSNPDFQNTFGYQ